MSNAGRLPESLRGEIKKEVLPPFLLSLAIEVECVLDVFFRRRLVNANVANVAQEGEIDVVPCVLLVVMHEGYQVGIVVARDSHASVVLL